MKVTKAFSISEDTAPRPILRRLMLPLTLLTLFLSISALTLLFQQHRHYLKTSFESRISQLSSDMSIIFEEQASGLNTALKPITADPDVQKGLRRGDAESLLAKWQPIFDAMKRDNQITHFYFLDKNRKCLLRVHNPAKHGDLIDRFTALEAEWTRKTSSGIELGPMGTFTLRVVQPVFEGKELIGYVELGKEIEDVLQTLQNRSDDELALFIHKNNLDRKRWEEGMRMLGREASWDLFGKNVLVYAPRQEVNESFIPHVVNHTHFGSDREIRQGERTWKITFIPMNDVTGKEMGDLMVMSDVTLEKNAFSRLIILSIIAATLLIGSVLAFLFLLLYRTDRAIRHQHSVLQQSEKRYGELAEQSRTVAWEIDSQGFFTYVSPVCEEVFGYRPDTLSHQMHVYDLHPEEGREVFKENLLGAYARGEDIHDLQTKALRSDGSTLWLSTNAFAILSEEGELKGYRGSSMEITDQVESRNAIVESRNLLMGILDTIPIRVFWKDVNLHYLGCNTLFAKDAGFESPESIIGKNDYQMVWEAQAEAYRADDRLVLESGVSKLFYEEQQTTPSGETIWLSTSKIPLRDHQNHIVGLIGIYEDVTERKNAEIQLRIGSEQLKEAQHIAHLGSWTFDLVSGELTWSDEVFHIFEIDPATFTPSYEAFLGAVHPEDRDAVHRAYTHALENKKPYEITHRLLMSDGRIKWVQERGESFYDEEGKGVRSVGTVQDITERKTIEETINTLAFFDPLTGLPNRVLLIDRLKQSMVSGARAHHYGALLFIDLDNFKTLNDTLGHETGDALLQQAGERLRECVRAEDTLARSGGDEFAVVLSSLHPEEGAAASESKAVAEKILAALNRPYMLGNTLHHSTASIGVTLFKGEGAGIEELMKQADLAMYKSKEAGRNGIRFFDPIMESALKHRTTLEDELRSAIAKEEFLLHYQAQVIDGGQITGAEVLVRWNHPQRGIVGPGEFIPIAEETGLILPLGRWILKTACAQLFFWETDPKTARITLAVNVSARQFSQKDFVEEVLSILAETGANPQKLKLELTESLLLHDIEEIIEKMARLKAIGISFSLDDFGTGYSSLSYLKRLPLDQLKIDQGFVRDILVDANDEAICRSTIALAQSMGLSVIAEGVETEEQKTVLDTLGCHAFQGYRFSRPLALEAFEALVQEEETL